MSSLDNKVSFQINGRQVRWEGDPVRALADVLREDLELTGTKIGCRTGECGACTVLIDGQPVNSCLIPAAAAADAEIETIEHLQDQPVFQRLVEAMAQTGGVQCGFCTPGIMVTLWAWLQDRTLFGGDVTSALKNNLCRCTGYRSIISAVEQVVEAEVSGR
ncbi:(2Fe-2S)-binding protein [Paenibacillus humicola]|uniref:(2Fe-2S)-binding protein n=1 Tax=Paenibacillus humicola TaxID=3110540 RepID=UPI00237C4C5D|nr:2Fe-2S iron-sulfur cluster-binding protein [Paenibacillus humicola]